MDGQSKAGDAWNIFCRDFGVPDNHTFDDSKEQTSKYAEFMKQYSKHGIKNST